MSSLSTHVLDAVTGAPAVDVAVQLFAKDENHASGWSPLAEASTNDDGRVPALATTLGPGTYRLVFDTQRYFDSRAVDAFYPEIVITFLIAEERHYHVPALLSPFAYSTYRGS